MPDSVSEAVRVKVLPALLLTVDVRIPIKRKEENLDQSFHVPSVHTHNGLVLRHSHTFSAAVRKVRT